MNADEQRRGCGRGRFITLEGGEGSGKTTQLRLMGEALAAQGVPHLLTREPGGSPLGERVRALLVEPSTQAWDAKSEMLLFMAARVEHVTTVILPALADGLVVLCDRFHDSTRVYQGMAKGLGVEYYDRLHRLILGGLTPDATFLLDIDAEAGLRRAATRGGGETKFEALGLAFHTRLREGFLALAAAEPERIHVIDAAQPPQEIHHRIWRRSMEAGR